MYSFLCPPAYSLFPVKQFPILYRIFPVVLFSEKEIHWGPLLEVHFLGYPLFFQCHPICCEFLCLPFFSLGLGDVTWRLPRSLSQDWRQRASKGFLFFEDLLCFSQPDWLTVFPPTSHKIFHNAPFLLSVLAFRNRQTINEYYLSDFPFPHLWSFCHSNKPRVSFFVTGVLGAGPFSLIRRPKQTGHPKGEELGFSLFSLKNPEPNLPYSPSPFSGPGLSESLFETWEGFPFLS